MNKNGKVFVNFSGENNIVADEITPNTEQNAHGGILKHSPDENTSKPPDGITRKRGSFLFSSDLNY